MIFLSCIYLSLLSLGLVLVGILLYLFNCIFAIKKKPVKAVTVMSVSLMATGIATLAVSYVFIILNLSA